MPSRPEAVRTRRTSGRFPRWLPPPSPALTFPPAGRSRRGPWRPLHRPHGRTSAGRAWPQPERLRSPTWAHAPGHRAPARAATRRTPRSDAEVLCAAFCTSPRAATEPTDFSGRRIQLVPVPPGDVTAGLCFRTEVDERPSERSNWLRGASSFGFPEWFANVERFPERSEGRTVFRERRGPRRRPGGRAPLEVRS